MKTSRLLLSLILIAFSKFAFSQDIKTVTREGYTVNYPATWTIDTEDSDYDPDGLFSFDAPDGQSMVMFIIMDEPIDEDTMMKYQLEAFSAMIENPEIKKFDTWGKYKGTGSLLYGEIMGILKGSIRIFVRKEENRTMLVVEQFYDENYETIKKDFLTISNSMTLK